MSGTEDYLDKLLNSVSDGKDSKRTARKKKQKSDLEDHFVKDFEKSLLSDEDDNDFLRQFEKELAEEQAEPGKEKSRYRRNRSGFWTGYGNQQRTGNAAG